jgi:hypothetical protein
MQKENGKNAEEIKVRIEQFSSRSRMNEVKREVVAAATAKKYISATFIQHSFLLI